MLSVFRYIHLLVRRGKQQTIASITELSELFHVPCVISLDVDLTFRSEQVKGCKF